MLQPRSSKVLNEWLQRIFYLVYYWFNINQLYSTIVFILFMIQDERNNRKSWISVILWKTYHYPLKAVTKNNLIFRLESFIKRTRWKEFFFNKNSEFNKQLNVNFGLKSIKTPPKNKHLNAFKNDLYDMLRNITFKNVKSSFQQQLQN